MMKARHAAIAAGLALGVMSTAAQAAYIVNIDQVGSNVVATGSGSVDTSGLGDSQPGNGTDFLAGNVAAIFIGSFLISADGFNSDTYLGLNGPMNFGNGPGINFNSETGNGIGIIGGLGEIFVPSGYVSGSGLGPSSATANNVTLAALGLAPGDTFMYSFRTVHGETEGLDTFTITVDAVSAVPLPASAPLFGAALFGLAGLGYAAKRKAKAAAA